MDPFITGPIVAVMMHVTFGFWGGETGEYVASYRDMATCRARIVTLDKDRADVRDPFFYRNHRYCRLEGVIQQ